MKDFAHPGGETPTPIDINHALETTLTVSKNEWKYVATVETALDPGLPPVPALSGPINQVFLNIVVNAAHANAEAHPDGTLGTIRVSSQRQGDNALIAIEDDGTGMPEEVRARIFEPFFTTKGVGRGTGQGLAIAHQVVVEQHGGSIAVHSTPGQGSRFEISLPLTRSEP